MLMLSLFVLLTISVLPLPKSAPKNVDSVPWSAEYAVEQEKHFLKNVATGRLMMREWKLAGGKYAGRAAGSLEGYESGIWLVKEMEKYGLVPLNEIDPEAPITPEPTPDMHVPDGFPVPDKYVDWFALGMTYYYPPVDLTWVEEEKTYNYGTGSDYAVFSYSGSGDVTAEVVFVGYGITAPELNYDDYAGIDVTGKIVLCFRHGPNHVLEDWHPPYWFFGYKSWNAYMHGAAGFIMVSDPRVHPMDAGSGTLSADYFVEDLPAVWGSTYTVGSDLTPTGTFEELLDLEVAIDDWVFTEEPYNGNYSFATGKTFHLEVHGEYDPNRACFSVIGVLPGQSLDDDDPENDKYVVIGGHRDHLVNDPTGAIYPGACDDASGTDVVLEVARIMSKLAMRPWYSVIFALWDGEEEGLWGSYDFFSWENPDWTVEHVVANINLDMVGHGDGTQIAYDAHLNDEMLEAVTEAGAAAGIPLVLGETAGCNSDHCGFRALEIPDVFFFSAGPHIDYHTPRDTPDKIDPYSLYTAAVMAGLVTWSWANPIPDDPTLPILGLTSGGGGGFTIETAVVVPAAPVIADD